MKTKELSKETKAALEVIIHEIQEILDATHCTSEFNLKMALQELIDSWIKANKLHPEKVITITTSQNNTINWLVSLNARWDSSGNSGNWQTFTMSATED